MFYHDPDQELTDLTINAIDKRRNDLTQSKCRCDAVQAKLRKAAYKALADSKGITEITAKKRFTLADNGTMHFCCVICCDCQYERMLENLEVYEGDE